MSATPGVGIVGCGLVGQKRSKHMEGARLVIGADVDPARAQSVAATAPGAVATTDWRDVVCHPDVAIVCVATSHNLLAEITLAALERGRHVLVEKPAARHAMELAPVVAAARRARGALVRVGFNHRYHPALQQAHAWVADGVIGELLYIRGRYGHGGRLGYEKEWRADPGLSGGGELLDQGVHLIDLSRWFLGDFKEVIGFAHTYYWKMPVDDNAFLLLKTELHQVAHLHVSWTEWKNLFCFEIFGRDGKLQIDGLGGSYGLERLTHYRMLPQMGPPEVEVREYPGADQSWQLEFDEFLTDIRLKRESAPGMADAFAALKIVDQVYAQSSRPSAASQH